MSEVERTFLMGAYDPVLGVLDDYAEMVIQVGDPIFYLQSLSNRFAIALKSLSNRFAIALQSLSNRFAIS